MRFVAAVVLSLLLPACEAGSKDTQQSPHLSIADLTAEPVTSFEGQLVVGNGPLDVYGLVARGQHPQDPALIVVELLTSQTASAMQHRGIKIDVLSTVIDFDCSSLRYRRSQQISYAASGQPLVRLNNETSMTDLPSNSILGVACDPGMPGVENRGHFSSMPEFLAQADAVLKPRRATLAPVIVTATPSTRPD